MDHKRRANRERMRRARRKKKIFTAVRRTVLCLLTALILVVGSLYAAIGILCRGPSQTAGDIFVNTVMETSALKFLAGLYYSQAEIDEILDRNKLVMYEDETDTSMIVIAPPREQDETGGEAADPDAQEEPDIQVVDVSGSTFYGYMMIIKDPSRVFVGMCAGDFGGRAAGKTVEQMIDHYGAVAGVNGGAFVDDNGRGNGGTPDGIVISGGEIKWKKIADRKLCNTLIGITNDNKLFISGKLDAEAAIEKGVRDAVTFGPALILNGEPATIKGSSSGMNPRTCIGQRADGAMLLLMINGRRANSLGATLTDLIDIMMEYGAVNAANLDGGSSSVIYYEGEYLNPSAAVVGMRGIATSFLVK